jgi:hypothetical protein
MLSSPDYHNRPRCGGVPPCFPENRCGLRFKLSSNPTSKNKFQQNL